MLGLLPHLQEGALKTAQVQAQASIAADAPAGTQLITGAQPGSNAAGLGLAALLAGMLLASPTGRANVVGGVRWTLGAVVGTAVGAATVAWRAARSIRLPKLPNRREEYAAAAAAAAAKAAAEAARRAVAEEMSYLTAAAATPPSPAVAAASAGKAGGATGARRLSEDEVQQRIAVMKGEAGPRAPTPQRPAPKPLSRPASVARPADDPIRASQYGAPPGWGASLACGAVHLQLACLLPSCCAACLHVASRSLHVASRQRSCRPAASRRTHPCPTAQQARTMAGARCGTRSSSTCRSRTAVPAACPAAWRCARAGGPSWGAGSWGGLAPAGG